MPAYCLRLMMRLELEFTNYQFAKIIDGLEQAFSMLSLCAGRVRGLRSSGSRGKAAVKFEPTTAQEITGSVRASMGFEGITFEAPLSEE